MFDMMSLPMLASVKENEELQALCLDIMALLSESTIEQVSYRLGEASICLLTNDEAGINRIVSDISTIIRDDIARYKNATN